MKLLNLGRCALVSVFSLGLLVGNLTAEVSNYRARVAVEAVQEALQREVYGLDEDRDRLLAAALKADPNNVLARSHAGFVRSAQGKWVKAGELTDRERQRLLAKYQEFRVSRRETPEDQLAIADWCAEHGLPEQERAHLLRVSQLAPEHAVARERLGFVKDGTEWLSREERIRQEVVKGAEKEWTATLKTLWANASSPDSKTRRAAVTQLQQIQDPAVLPALATMASYGEPGELFAAEIAGQITDPAAAVALARQAVLSHFANVRKVAAAKLDNYDQDAYVPSLVASLYTPVTTQYNAFARGGQVNYHHQFVREGLIRREMLVVDAAYRNASSGNQNFAKAMALGNAAETARQLESEAAAQNELTQTTNERIAAILRKVTDADLPAEPAAWWNWWTEHSEVFVEGVKPTATVHHMVAYNVLDRGMRTVDSSRQDSLNYPVQPRYDCFAAGTPVWTEQGKVAIEQVRVGDLVLSRNVETGELAYKPVVRTTTRPAGQLVRIRAGHETFETSGGHLFWVSGEGWVKSRELRSGMVLHTATGPVRISETATGSHAPTYNLVVDDFNTYFVGEQRVLSHDNTVKRIVNVAVPGLKAE